MSGIRGKDTRPELLVRSILHRDGFRFRLQRKDLPGKPDIVLSRYKAVVFVHGCFWHGHDCSYFKWPQTRAEFWATKIKRNRENDDLAMKTLLKDGWRVGVVWECAMRGRNQIGTEGISAALSKWLRSGETTIVLPSLVTGL